MLSYHSVNPYYSAIAPRLWNVVSEGVLENLHKDRFQFSRCRDGFQKFSSVLCERLNSAVALYGVHRLASGPSFTWATIVDMNRECIRGFATPGLERPDALQSFLDFGPTNQRSTNALGLCADAGDGKTSGAAITTQTCDEKSEGQAWVFAKDGTVRLQSNLCLDVANADPSQGAVVIADACNGSAGQYWTLQGFGNLIQSNVSGYCMTEGSAGAQLTMQPCTADNIWLVPQIPVLP